MAANTKIFIPKYISSVTSAPARVLPHIYFYNGQRECEPWYIEGYSGSATTSSATIVTQSVDTFPQLDYYSQQQVTGSSLSLLFNNEFTPYGTIPSESLYSEYWETYVSLLYDAHTRLVACSAIIPLADYFTTNLNDVVEWRGNYYYLRAINDYNIANGECNLQLLGPILDDTLTVPFIPPVDCNFNFTAVTPTSTTTSTTSTSTTTLGPGQSTTTTSTSTSTSTSSTTTSAPTTTTTTTAGPTTTSTTTAAPTTTTTTTAGPSTSTTSTSTTISPTSTSTTTCALTLYKWDVSVTVGTTYRYNSIWYIDTDGLLQSQVSYNAGSGAQTFAYSIYSPYQPWRLDGFNFNDIVQTAYSCANITPSTSLRQYATITWVDNFAAYAYKLVSSEGTSYFFDGAFVPTGSIPEPYQICLTAIPPVSLLGSPYVGTGIGAGAKYVNSNGWSITSQVQCPTTTTSTTTLPPTSTSTSTTTINPNVCINWSLTGAAGEGSAYSYYNCNNDEISGFINANQSITICVHPGTTPFITPGGFSTNLGTQCGYYPSTTSTSTTTIAPGTCLTYRATNNGGGTAAVTYVNCYNVSGSINVGGGTFEDFCAKYNTPQSLGDVTFTILSGCIVPTSTSTSTTTSGPTTTSTSTSTTSTTTLAPGQSTTTSTSTTSTTTSTSTTSTTTLAPGQSTTTSTSTTTASSWFGYNLFPVSGGTCDAIGDNITAYKYNSGGSIENGDVLYATQNLADPLVTGYYSDGGFRYEVNTGIVSNKTACPSPTSTSTSTSTTSTTTMQLTANGTFECSLGTNCDGVFNIASVSGGSGAPYQTSYVVTGNPPSYNNYPATNSYINLCGGTSYTLCLKGSAGDTRCADPNTQCSYTTSTTTQPPTSTTTQIPVYYYNATRCDNSTNYIIYGGTTYYGTGVVVISGTTTYCYTIQNEVGAQAYVDTVGASVTDCNDASCY
jgi:hypothetical protein